MLSVLQNPFSNGASSAAIEEGAPDAAHILSSSRRLDTIEVLAEAGEAMRMSHLTDAVTEMEAGEFDSDDRKRVYITLYQSHLPQLDRKGVIEYEKSRGIVRPGPQLQEYYELMQDVEAACRGDRHD